MRVKLQLSCPNSNGVSDDYDCVNFNDYLHVYGHAYDHVYGHVYGHAYDHDRDAHYIYDLFNVNDVYYQFYYYFIYSNVYDYNFIHVHAI